MRVGATSCTAGVVLFICLALGGMRMTCLIARERRQPRHATPVQQPVRASTALCCMRHAMQVVFMNQVTTQVKADQPAKLVPALGGWVPSPSVACASNYYGGRLHGP